MNQKMNTIHDIQLQHILQYIYLLQLQDQLEQVPEDTKVFFTLHITQKNNSFNLIKYNYNLNYYILPSTFTGPSAGLLKEGLILKYY